MAEEDYLKFGGEYVTFGTERLWFSWDPEDTAKTLFTASVSDSDFVAKSVDFNFDYLTRG